MIYQSAPFPANENERLVALRSYAILDTPPEEDFDSLTALASQITSAPLAFISLMDADRQWFKSRIGVTELETPRKIAFCAHAILQPGVFIVPDAREDWRFAGNPLVTGTLGIRFYAGVPLVTAEGLALGTLCVADREPRTLTAEQQESLRALGRQVVAQLVLRRQAALLRTALEERTKAMTALQERYQLVQRIADALPEVLYIFDLTEEKVIFSNQQVQAVLGYEATEIQRQEVSFFKTVLHAEDWPAFVTRLEQYRAAKMGEVLECVYRARCANGEWRWLHSRDTVLTQHADGTPQLILGVAQDITEKTRGESALLDGVQIAALNRDISSVLTRTDSLEDMLSECAAELVEHFDAALARIWTLNANNNVLELQASAGMYLHVDGKHGRIPVGKFKIGRIAQERRPHLTNTVVGDPLIHDQDWAKREGLVSFAGYPLLVDDRLVGVLGLFARHPLPELTLSALETTAKEIALGIERKRIEKALRQSESRLRAIFHSVAVGIAFVNTEGYFVESNPALQTMLGYSEEELQKKNFVELTHPDDTAADLDCFVELLAGERKLYQIEKRYIRRDGEMFWARLTASLVQWTSATSGFVVGIVEDISAQKRTEEDRQREMVAVVTLAQENARLREEAERASRLKNEFLATISHELRTPLHIILGYLSLAFEGDFGPVSTELAEGLHHAEKSARQLCELITSLLDVCQLRAGETELQSDDVSLARLRVDVQDEFLPLLAERSNLRFTWRDAVARIALKTDRLKLKIILRNLIQNAIKFTPHGEVSIDTAPQGEGLEFTISDTGVGIPLEVREEIFDMFRQINGTMAARPTQGLGLGLYLARRFTDLLGGSLSVESKVGQGSTFRLWVPGVYRVGWEDLHSDDPH